MPESPNDSEFHSVGEGRMLMHSNSSRVLLHHFNPLSDQPAMMNGARFLKSVDFNLTVKDKDLFRRCLFVSLFILILFPGLLLPLHFLRHKKEEPEKSMNLSLALNQALLFFDIQKSGHLRGTEGVNFRGNSGLEDGKDGKIDADLVGGYYDSGNNMKFTFSTAYTVTLLSWTVVEYEQKYKEIGELDHIKGIIKWGADYLLKAFVPPSTDHHSPILYSQVGGNGSVTNQESDVSCWQRPEDLQYRRPVSVCDATSADLAGEIVAAMSAASLVFSQDQEEYSIRLVEAATTLFDVVTGQDLSPKLGTYTAKSDACGAQARDFYNSTTYLDELIWGGTWLFFATGNSTYLKYATEHLVAAEREELDSERGVFSWNNKVTANAVLLTRIRYFIDLGYPYEEALSTNRTDLLMCSFLSAKKSSSTQGGLVLLKPDANHASLQYAATASFLSKLYSDYLQLLSRSVSSCNDATFSVQKLRNFSTSQVNYILGDNPMKMSYVVGYGGDGYYPKNVHHRGASVPWDGKWHSCSEGNEYLYSKDMNPNIVTGAMVGGPDEKDVFLDDRDKPLFTEPSISNNAGLVAALIALYNPPSEKLGISQMSIFQNVY